ncbi:MAG: hypothetical protein Q4A05_03865 [Ruminococcus sp.]|nr:hypothetical protein [Ruminococcus sp.]
MTDANEYKCPCCGAKLEFNSAAQKMKCPYCDSEFDVETVQDYNLQLSEATGDDMSWESEAGGEWEEGETNNMRVYSCKSCGGQIIAEETTGASFCPYCNNPVIMAGTFSGDLRPDLVIPFKLDKAAAKAAYERYISGKSLLPKVFKDQNHIDEIKGLYVPVWLFGAQADANMCFRAETRKTWYDANYHYVETSYYQAIRKGRIAFEHVPVDGSEKMPDDLMESIEPFDFSQAVDFKTAYLSGYLADKYDVSADDSIARANERIKKSTEAAFAATVRGYDTVRCESSAVKLNGGKAQYALYPVWILNTTWNDQKYMFAMNGQTGKLVGNLPADKGKAAGMFIGITGGVGFVLSLLWIILHILSGG